VDFLLRLSADKVIELLEARNWSSERIEGGVEGQSAHCTEDYTKLKGGTPGSRKGRARVYGFTRKGSQPRGASCTVFPLSSRTNNSRLRVIFPIAVRLMP
jgi:hypothetical protein